MINLDQVRTLEWKVKQAVQLIVHLRRENDTLRGRLSDTEVRLQELESLLETFKASQSELESGIMSALEELDNLDAGSEPPVSAAPVPAVTDPPEPESEPEVPATFTEQDPAALFERSVSFAADDPAASAETADLSFEEEFAALAAQEEAAAASTVPDSVELEPEVETAPEAEAPVQEEKKPEQPGLGIF